MNMRNLRVIAGPGETITPTASERLLARKADLIDAVERLRQKNVSAAELGKMLSNLRAPLWHSTDPLFRTMSTITSLEEINTLERRMDIHFVRSGITSLKQCGHWPFLPRAAEETGGQKVEKAILRKVQSVVPLVSGGWKSLGIMEDELRRCATLIQFLNKRYVISMALFNVVEMSKLYPDINQNRFKDEVAVAIANANELRYRVAQGEFTFAELYTTEAKIEQTLRHINKALAKLAP